MPSVKYVMLEVHIKSLEGTGMQRIFNDFHAAGFFYDPNHSYREIVVFKKL
jgi:hypothetical protein